MPHLQSSRAFRARSASVLALGVALSWSGFAAAQAPATPPEDTTVQEFVVTSSRIDRAGFEAPTPTTVVGAAELREGARPNIAAVLNDLPQFRATFNPGNTAVSANLSGSQSADLRGLGATRTLVLLNGHRFVGDSDLNTVPFDLVERVEVVTGGASAVWGSGAIAGVVNVILNDRLEGGQISAQTGISSRGDGQEYRVGARYGKIFAGGRGHVMGDVEYYYNEGIFPITQRKNVGGWAVLANPNFTATNGQHAFVIAPNVGPTNLSSGGLIVSGVLAGQTFNPDGTLRPFNFGTLRGPSFSSGGQQPTADNFRYMTAPVKRLNAFVRGSYEVADNIKAAADLRFTTIFNQYLFAPDLSAGVTIRNDNAFLPTAVRNALAGAGQTSFTFGRLNEDFAFRELQFRRDDLQATFSLEGRLGDGWRWDAYYTHGERLVHQQLSSARILANFNNAVDSVIGPNGQAVCRSTLTNPTNGCVPIDLFGFGKPSQAAQNYINGVANLKTRQKLDSAAVSLRGEPLSLWAGPVSIAVGAEARRESINTLENDPIALANGFSTVNSKGFIGDFTAKEAFGEIVVPLIKDAPLFRQLEFNGAARISDYSRSGSITSWKAGLSWRVTDDLRLRAVQSRDSRAGSLSEFFTAGGSSTATINDPVTRTQYTVTAVTGGNPALEPETSDTTTFGVVYSPSWAPGLSLSVDHYDIDIDGAISTLSGQDIVTRCFNGNQDLCPLITRTNGTITRIQSTFINLANYKTSGTDIEASYSLPVDRLWSAGAGTLRVRALANHVEKLTTFDGVARVYSKGVVGTGVSFGVPEWRGTAGLSWQNGETSVDLRARYVDGGTFNPLIDIANNKVSSRTYVDLSFETGVPVIGRDGFTLFGSVTNLLDKDPPVAGNPQHYDIVGRFFTLGARARF